jgi:hypothetical protein
VIEVVLAQLNAVRLTEDQVRHGFRVLITAGLDGNVSAVDQLLQFVRTENLYPPDVAAEAIAIRAGWLGKFVADGGDPEIDWEYERFATAVIAVKDLDLDRDAEDNKMPW